jgi:hypothetical protein
VSSNELSLILSIALAVLGNAGTVVVFCKPDRLRFAEVPAWFLVMLAGRESRERLRRILARRELAAREAVTERVQHDAEVVAAGEAGALPLRSAAGQARPLICR